MIDWWLFVLFNMLVLTLAFHTYLGYVISKAKSGSSKESQIKVLPINSTDRNSYSEKMKEEVMRKPMLMNKIANIAFVVFVIIFNIIFWFIAIAEHLALGEKDLKK